MKEREWSLKVETGTKTIKRLCCRMQCEVASDVNK